MQSRPDETLIHHEPLVSVLIPVYNAEHYLSECLDSILVQSYQSLDIVLLDDGSTDNSSDICNEYAAHDSRVRVTRVANGGISRARNLCLRLARGELLFFVDADDWIEPETIRKLVNVSLSENADIVSCRYIKEWVGYSEAPSFTFGAHTLRDEEVLGGLLRDKLISDATWGKLYRAELFKDVCYPEGHLFEDIATTYRLCLNARTVVCLPDAFVHYRMRENSLGKTHSAANLVDYWLAYIQQYNNVLQVTDNFKESLLDYCVFSIGRTWRWWATVPIEMRQTLANHISDMRSFARAHTTEVLHGNFSVMRKIECVLGRWASPCIWIPLHLITRIRNRFIHTKKPMYY